MEKDRSKRFTINLLSVIKKTSDSIARMFSFIETPMPTYPMAFYRIGLSIICFGKFLVLLPNLSLYYGPFGLVQWSISKVDNFSFIPHVGDVAIKLSGITGISLQTSFFVIASVFATCCLLMLLGCLTRLATFICFYLHLAFINTGSAFIYGVDVFTQVALFYALFFPLNSIYAIDNLLKFQKRKTISVSAGIALRVLQLQLCIVYFSTAIEKALGIQWWNGEAIWRTLMMPIFRSYDFEWLSGYPVLAMIIGWSVILVEGSYIFFMWSRLRGMWLLMIVMLHSGIGVFMGMWFFAIIMIFLSVVGFGHDYVHRFIKSLLKAIVLKKPGYKYHVHSDGSYPAG